MHAVTTPPPRIALVAAVTRDGGIGKGGDLLVRISEDQRHFRRLTMGNPVVMGRKTWQSIGKALPGRRNIVVSRDRGFVAAEAEVVPSLADAISLAGAVETVFVIGGAALYAEALAQADGLYLTEIDATVPADTFFPLWNRDEFVAVSRDERRGNDGTGYAFVEYRRRDTGPQSSSSPRS